MKNLWKASFLILAVSASLAACNGNGNNNSGDTTAKSDSSVKADTSVKVDSVKPDTTAAATTDTTAKPGVDTVKKSVTTKTVVKKETKKQ